MPSIVITIANRIELRIIIILRGLSPRTTLLLIVVGYIFITIVTNANILPDNLESIARGIFNAITVGIVGYIARTPFTVHTVIHPDNVVDVPKGNAHLSVTMQVSSKGVTAELKNEDATPSVDSGG